MDELQVELEAWWDTVWQKKPTNFIHFCFHHLEVLQHKVSCKPAGTSVKWSPSPHRWAVTGQIKAVTLVQRKTWSRRQPLQCTWGLKCAVFQGAQDMVSIYKKGAVAAWKWEGLSLVTILSAFAFQSGNYRYVYTQLNRLHRVKINK